MSRPKRRPNQYFAAPDFIPGVGTIPSPSVHKVVARPSLVDVTAENDNKAKIGGLIEVGQFKQSKSVDNSVRDALRPTLMVRRVTGDITTVFGHLGGLKWGGSAYTIPEGTYGVWADRNGSWFTAYTIMSYANFGEQDFTSTGFNPATNNIVSVRISQIEEFPFGTLNVPAGRIIVPEVKVYSASLDINAPVSVSSTSGSLRTATLRATVSSILGDYPYLPGHPNGVDAVDYVGVGITLVWDFTFAAFNWNASATYTLTRHIGIQLWAHEVNAPTTISHDDIDVFDAGSTPADFGGGTPPETDPVAGDPGGGSGQNNGGYSGEGPGGDLIV